MFEVVLKNPKALTFSVLFHMVIIIAIVINFEFFDMSLMFFINNQNNLIKFSIFFSFIY